MKPRVVALAGPTASGKTELGIALAQALDAEIVNADSRQVFRRLDIGSAKPSLEQRALVPHHLFDVVDPDDHFDAARYRALATAAIADIHRRGGRALLVGGTGLYLKVVRGGLFEGPRRDPELRARLNAEEDGQSGVLHQRLQAVDAEAAARLHPNDRMRLVRALEVFEATGRPISEWQAQHRFGSAEIEVLTLALEVERAELYQRIDRRCVEMLGAGLVQEVEQLLADGYGPELVSMQCPGYREIAAHVLGNSSLADALARMQQATRRLAKRQMTWFRGDAQTRWCAAELARLVAQAGQFWDAVSSKP